MQAMDHDGYVPKEMVGSVRTESNVIGVLQFGNSNRAKMDLKR